MSIASAEVTAKLSIAIETEPPANNDEVGSATEAFTFQYHYSNWSHIGIFPMEGVCLAIGRLG